MKAGDQATRECRAALGWAGAPPCTGPQKLWTETQKKGGQKGMHHTADRYQGQGGLPGHVAFSLTLSVYKENLLMCCRS